MLLHAQSARYVINKYWIQVVKKKIDWHILITEKDKKKKSKAVYAKAGKSRLTLF